MAAYVVVQVEVTDAEKYGAYTKLTPATLERYGGKFIVRGGAMEDLEGHWDVPRLVVIEFESMAQARKWYSSPEYQEAKAVRAGGANVTFTLVEGLEG